MCWNLRLCWIYSKRSQPLVEFRTWGKSWNCSAFKIHCKLTFSVLAVEPGLLQGCSCSTVSMQVFKTCVTIVYVKKSLELTAGLQMGSHNGACIRPQAFTDSQGQCCIWPRALKLSLSKASSSPTTASEPLCHELQTKTHFPNQFPLLWYCINSP